MSTAGIKVFSALSVKDHPTIIDDKHSPDLANVRIDNPIGALSNMEGIDKYNSVGFGASIVAIHQLNGHIFSLSGSTLYEGYPNGWTVKTGFGHLCGIHYDSASDYIYVADTFNYRLVKTQIDGTGWATYGSSGSGTNQFSLPWDIHYDPTTEYLYIADTTNHRIVKTKWDGTGWTTLGTQGSEVNQFNQPRAIHYDSVNDYIYVADHVNHRIIKTKIDGTDWTSLGTRGSGANQFDYPDGIFYDSASEYIYVGDQDNYRVVKTKIDGTGWETLGTQGSGDKQFGESEKDIYYDSASEYLYIADSCSESANDRIVKTKIDGTGWTTYGTQGSDTNQFHTPNGIFYDSVSGYVYIADSLNNRVVKVAPDWS